MRALITGHRGYIGSVMAVLLKEQGIYCVGVDNNFETSRHSVDINLNETYSMNVSDPEIGDIINQHQITHIFHFAASVDVAVSVEQPAFYYWNNLGETAKLLDNLQRADWKGKFIFSSTAAVYGEQEDCVGEDDPKDPCNPYGTSKLMCEMLVRDVCKQSNIDAVIFRYFNVVGSFKGFGDRQHSDHILPKICSAINDELPFYIYGADYPTRDGTCVRDYIHVLDVCRAHLHVVDYLDAHKGVHIFNLGSSRGITNKELVEAFQEYTDTKFEYRINSRRAGDPALLIANNKKFVECTGFEYKHSGLVEIVKSTWEQFRHFQN